MNTKLYFRTKRISFAVSVFAAPVWALFLSVRPLGEVLSFAAAVLLHEAGHAVVLCLCGIPIRSITVSAFGISVSASRRMLSYRKEAFLYLAGPLVNLLSAAMILPHHALAPFRAFGVCSLLLGIYNLIPVMPLDGGKTLSAILSIHLSQSLSARLSRGISLLFAAILWIVGSAVLLSGAVSSPRGVIPSGPLFCVGTLLFLRSAAARKGTEKPSDRFRRKTEDSRGKQRIQEDFND